jgi:hypothetical protein
LSAGSPKPTFARPWAQLRRGDWDVEFRFFSHWALSISRQE